MDQYILLSGDFFGVIPRSWMRSPAAHPPHKPELNCGSARHRLALAQNYCNPYALIISARIRPTTESMKAETANGR